MNLRLIFSFLPYNYANAHCDVPCGIYDPKGAQTAALTVLKMVQKIKEHEGKSTLEDINTITRSILTKEEHSRICKEELLILWTDYFKPEHLERFADLHDIFWKAAKLCSQNKQHVDEKLAQDLIDATNHIADIFQESKTS